MDKGKAPLEPQTPDTPSTGSNNNLKAAWREVETLEIWKIRENESPIGPLGS